MNLEENKFVLATFPIGVNNVIFSVDSYNHQLLVLLVKQKETIFNNQWSLPVTLVRNKEFLKKASKRILSEKIIVNNLYLEQLYTFEIPNLDSKVSLDSFCIHYISVSYFALVNFEEAELLSINSYNGTTWCIIKKIPQLVFDHNQILDYGYQRLRNKLEYSPIAFKFLPKLFTLNDIYQIYITILEKNFTNYFNFRFRLLKLCFLIGTSRKVSRRKGKSTTLYCFSAEAFAPLKDKHFIFI
ncbi:MAG: NUDIX hydrolase [cyanobacterium endosymbiont of Rhopalodia fuxianensis]